MLQLAGDSRQEQEGSHQVPADILLQPEDIRHQVPEDTRPAAAHTQQKVVDIQPGPVDT